MNILIVDDHEVNRYLQETMLKANGHDVRQAANGEEAFEILQAGGIDLIISDILMPVMDGFQLCRKVKTDANLRAIPFIIYTATYTGPKDHDFALKIGADRFIEKPCEPEIFMKAVDEVIASAGHLKRASVPVRGEEEEVLRLYSERLVRKLEQKMVQAEQEIEARQKAEKALVESRERLIAAQRMAKMGDFVWDVETGEVTWSDALFDLLQYEKSETFDYAGINAKIYHPDDVERITRWLGNCIASGTEELTPNEYRVIRKDGQILFVRTVGVIQQRVGKKPKIFATVQDITERIQMDKERENLKVQLFQAQKMESVGRLAGGVAHDFNNMLSIIIGYAEFGMENVKPGDPLHTDLVEIMNAAERSKDITRQLLAFARQQTIAPKVLNLNDAIENMLKMFRRLIGEDIDLAWRPAPDVWSVKIDPSQVDQILVNLCVNARDAIADVGKVTIETQNMSIDEDYSALHPDFFPGEYVLLTVSDDGYGIATENLDMIFEPFFTTKGIGKGTGLGLATVYGIVKQNKGFINVYSETENGTTFKIYLPRHKGKTDKTSSGNAHEIPKGKGETVLLVEDDQAIMKMSKRMLERLGYQVLEASAPSEAMRLAEKYAGSIHLLITDVVMPEMNGRDLSDRLHALYPDLKILFMSGYTSDVIAHRGVLDEGVNFIQKPFTKKEMAFKVCKALGREGF
ncbi:MAG: response regulator [Desulfobulbaceae bacterium]|nr:response regulator [Desulfobulbaceae bacterium]